MKTLLMRPNIIFALCMILSGSGLAQSPQVDLGPSYADPYFSSQPAVVGFDTKAYYFLQSEARGLTILNPFKRDKMVLRKFGLDLKAGQSVELNMKTNDGREDFQELFMIQGQLHLFSRLVNPDKRTVSLFHRLVDKSDLSSPKRGTEIVTVSYEGFKKNKFVDFNFLISPDSSKVLLYYQLPNKKDYPERFGAQLFSAEMVSLWQQDFELPYAEKLFETTQFEISNNGNAFVLGRRFFDKPKERVAGEPNYTYKLLRLRPGEESPEEFTLELEGKFLVDMQMGFIKGQQILCAGVYAIDKPKFIKGVYTLSFDPEKNEIVQESSQEMTLAMFEDGEEKSSKKTKKPGKNEKKAFVSYEFLDMIPRSDGGALLVAEARYVYSYSTFVPNGVSGGTWVPHTVWRFNDIIAMDMGPEGDIQHATRIPKNQRQEDVNWLLGYTLAVGRKGVHFIYNDHLENLALEAGKKPKRYQPSIFGKRKQVVEIVTLSPEGTYDRAALISTKEAGQYAIPRASMQISRGELILLFQKGKKRRLGRVWIP